MTVLSSLGYCRIGSVQSARAPTRRIKRLTTSDSTGRRMKRSVKVMTGSVSHGSIGRDLRGQRQRLGFRQRHRGAVEELDLAGADHPIARFQAVEDRDL